MDHDQLLKLPAYKNNQRQEMNKAPKNGGLFREWETVRKVGQCKHNNR
jgi:hypothetical protein